MFPFFLGNNAEWDYWIIRYRYLILCRNANSEKAMAPYFSTLAWKIPWTEDPGGLPFMGSLRVGHD